MIYCRGCGKSIHETAITCPACGAQQSIQLKNNNKLNQQENTHWTTLTSFISGLILFFLVLAEPDGDWDQDVVIGMIVIGTIPIIFGIIAIASERQHNKWMSITGIILGAIICLISLGSY